jgi:replication fork protection complex subunit Tof1/Swi1
VRDVLTSAVEERKAWEDAAEARKALEAAELLDGEDAPADTEAEPSKPPSIRKCYCRSHGNRLTSISHQA